MPAMRVEACASGPPAILTQYGNGVKWYLNQDRPEIRMNVPAKGLASHLVYRLHGVIMLIGGCTCPHCQRCYTDIPLVDSKEVHVDTKRESCDLESGSFIRRRI